MNNIRSIFLLSLWLYLGVCVAQADVMVVDAIQTGSANSNSSAHTISSTGYSVGETGNDNLLVVFYTAYGEGGGSDPTLTSASFGGVSLNIAATATAYDGFEATTSIAYMKESDFGSISGSDLVFTRSGSSNGDRGMHYGIFTLSGVDQTSPVGDFGGDAVTSDPNPISVNLTGLNSGGLILSAITGNAADSVDALGSLVNDDIHYADLYSVPYLVSRFLGTEINGSSETIGATFDNASYGAYPGDRSAMVSVEFIAVPEPSSLMLMLSAAVGGVLLFRRRS